MEVTNRNQKTVIFIDSNVYLRFFDTKQNNFKKLLGSVEEIYSYIFITKQIFDEVERNKFNRFQKSFEGYIEQSKLMKVQLPDHLSFNTDLSREWNRQRLRLEKIGREQLDRLREIYVSISQEIYFGDDEVSSILSLIAAECGNIPDHMLQKARLRQEIGNPPGKSTDRLGDQINWELLLSYVEEREVEDLIIVSADNDYFEKTDDITVLKSLLYREITKARPSLVVFCYNTLAEGLSKFNEIRTIKNLPTSDELYRIQEEELLNHTIKQYLEVFGEEMPCPNCSSRHVTWNRTFRDNEEFREISCSECGFRYEYSWLGERNDRHSES